jgi:hypothetical protein
MSQTSPSIVEPGEKVLWEGRPLSVPWLPGVFFLSVFGFGLVLLLVFTQFRDSKIPLLISWFLVLIMISSALFLTNKETHYFITDRKIAKTIQLYFWKGVWTLPLELVAEATLKGSGKKQYVVFIPLAAGHKRIIFRKLENPETVRKIALHAQSDSLRAVK